MIDRRYESGKSFLKRSLKPHGEQIWSHFGKPRGFQL